MAVDSTPEPILQTFYAKQNEEISWDEYIHILLLRLTGIKNEDDNEPWALHRIDPFAFGVLSWSSRVEANAEQVQDIKPLEAVFHAYRYDTVAVMKQKLAMLDYWSIKEVKKLLALLALQERRFSVLRFCLDQGGFPYEAEFLEEVDGVNARTDPEIFTLLVDHGLPRRRTVRQSSVDLRKSQSCGPRPGFEASFHRGGDFPLVW